MIRSKIVGCGAYLPPTVLTNSEIAQRIDTSDEWIRERTGIRQRHVVALGEKTSDLALQASRNALAMAGMDANELDLIVCATTTPDETFPATATTLQARLNMNHGAAFDIQAVCSGFIYGMAVADNFIKTGMARTVLLVGAESMSRLLDWNDRTTCVLFGDGAGAVVLQADEGKGDNSDRGVLNTKLFSDGRLHDLLYVDGGPSSTQTTGQSAHAGQGSLPSRRDQHLRRHRGLAGRGRPVDRRRRLVRAAPGQPAHPRWHRPQARHRAAEGGHDRGPSTATPRRRRSPLALATAVADGRIKQGQLVLLEAMGGGFTWGASLIRW